MFKDFVSTEPLYSIRYNEAESGQIGSLCSQRFRRLFNEIEGLQSLVSVVEKVRELAHVHAMAALSLESLPLDLTVSMERQARVCKTRSDLNDAIGKLCTAYDTWKKEHGA